MKLFKLKKHKWDNYTYPPSHTEVRKTRVWVDSKGIKHTLCNMNQHHLENVLMKYERGGFGQKPYDEKYIRHEIAFRKNLKMQQNEEN